MSKEKAKTYLNDLINVIIQSLVLFLDQKQLLGNGYVLTEDLSQRHAGFQ